MPSHVDDKDHKMMQKMAMWVATASVLQISESLLPYPIPGLRFGFANIISLIILLQHGFKMALWVTLLRTLTSAFILGTFLSPGFILSFTSGLASMLVTGVLFYISCRYKVIKISPIGLSIAGAFTHNLTQICLAYLFLIRHSGIFFLIPWLSIGSVFMGAFSGVIAAHVINQLNQKTDVTIKSAYIKEPDFKTTVYVYGDSLIHRIYPQYKLLMVLGVTLLSTFIETFTCYLVLLIFFLGLLFVAKLPFFKTLSVIRKLSIIILSAFFISCYLNPGTTILFYIGNVGMHQEAIFLGGISSLRILILALYTSILAQTTHEKDLIDGINCLLLPLQKIGLNTSRFSQCLSLSLVALQSIWVELRVVIKTLLKGKKKNMKTMKGVVILLFVYVFTIREE